MFKKIFSVIALLLLMTPAFAETVRFSKGNTFSSLTTTGNTQIGDSSDDLLTIYSSSITLINGTTIWTNVPPLNIFGNMSLTDANQLSWGGANNFISGSNSSNFVRVISNNAERMRFGLFGTGIGTTQPVLPFEVAGGVLFRGSSFTVTSDNINLGNVSQAGVLGSTYTAASATLDVGALVQASSGNFTTTGSNASNVGLRVSSSVYLATSGGLVGIGTTSPATEFNLIGMASVTANTAATAHIITNNGSGPIALFMGAGNVGIGTTSPTQKLDIAGPLRITGSIGSANATNAMDFGGTGGTVYMDARGPNATTTANWQFRTIESDGGGALVWLYGNTGGNVGVGTTSPLGLFQVGGGTLTALGDGRVGIGTTTAASSAQVWRVAGTGGSHFTVSTGTTNLFEVNGASIAFGAVRSNFNGSVGVSSSTPSGLFTVGSSSGIVMNQFGHFEVFSSTNPTMLNCGTSPSFLPGSTDMNGKFQVGTGGSESVCNVTFSNSWTQAPSCWCANESQSQLVRSSSTATTLTCSLGVAFTAGDTINYGCLGRR